MIFSILAPLSLQVAVPRDTLITRVVTAHGALEYINGLLGTLVLLLAAATLITLIWAFMAIRRAATGAEASLKRLVDDAGPLMKNASQAASDARDTVAQLRSDLVSVTDAAAAISEPLRDGAEAVARRFSEVNAVLDVLQDELESSAISSVATVRGLRTGISELTAVFGGGSGSRGGGRKRKERELRKRDRSSSRKRENQRSRRMRDLRAED